MGGGGGGPFCRLPSREISPLWSLQSCFPGELTGGCGGGMLTEESVKWGKFGGGGRVCVFGEYGKELMVGWDKILPIKASFFLILLPNHPFCSCLSVSACRGGQARPHDEQNDMILGSF